MSDAWGGAWASAWGNSWGYAAVVLPQGRSQLSRADLIAIYEKEWVAKEAELEAALRSVTPAPHKARPRRAVRPAVEVHPTILPPLEQEEQGKLPAESQVNVPELVAKMMKELQKPVVKTDVRRRRQKKREEEALMIILTELSD